MAEYKKTCADEIDWASVNQLHEATLNISKSCFEFKKICVSLIGVALALLVKLTDNQLGHEYFIIPLLICFGFWMADFSAHYYQRKTRVAMNIKLAAIAKRNSISHRPENLTVSLFGSLFNYSMTLYFSLSFIGFSGWLAYMFEYIGK